MVEIVLRGRRCPVDSNRREIHNAIPKGNSLMGS